MDVQVGMSREGLSMTRLKQFPIPLPPLNEQKRIVTIVNQLLTQCDQLTQKIQSRQETTQKLLTASIHQILQTGKCNATT